MKVADLAGRAYGPAALDVVPSRVEDFVAATADEPERWRRHAPPGYAASALFTVAPGLLADGRAAGITRSVVHTEQAFTWHRPLRMGERLEVSGGVEATRSRGPLTVVTFRAEAAGEEPWLSSSSTFLLSAEAAAAAGEEPEPAHDLRAECDPASPLPLPEDGSPLPPLRRSASRGDLVRYAGATGDWNPIHWDHDAARAAGLPGIVVHGLLIAAWLVQAAGRYGCGPSPLAELRARFRSPLRPGVPAEITGTVSDRAEANLRLELRAGGARPVTATARVTR